MADTAELWDAGRVARFLGYSYDYFRKVIRYQEGVPQPLERPGRDRWLSTDWIAWAEKSRPNHAKAA
jgi:hypothetical protein